MDTKFIEAGQSIAGERGQNWGKFCVGRYSEEELARPSHMGGALDRPLVAACGWGVTPKHVWVMDMQTGEAAYFRPGGKAGYDLREKHQIWVCPMFEPFLEWLYAQDLSDLQALPDTVELPEAPFALSGYRRRLRLTISAELRDLIVAHARTDHPMEACGMIAGHSGQPERFIPMRNAEESLALYRFDPAEQLKVWQEMEERDERPVIIYHSHTAGEAFPSVIDTTYANEPDAHYVLVSTADPDWAEFRSYRIVDGDVTEERVRIVGGDPVER